MIWLVLLGVTVTARHVTACGGSFTADSGTITSPGYPSNYSNNLHCVYTVTRPEGERITLNFTSLDIDAGAFGCIYDNVTIRDGSSSSLILKVVCGSTLPVLVRSFANSLWISFTTDNSIVATGFSATFTSAVHNDTFYLVTESRFDRVFHIDYETFSHVSVPLSTYPFAVDFDPVDRRIYWTDLFNRDISTADLDGSNQERFFLSPHRNASLTGLAVDPLSRLLFYADAGSRQLGMLSLSGAHHATVISTKLGAPRCLALDTMNGVLYWTDVGVTVAEKIERANYDGSDRWTLVSRRLHTPNGLALDLPNNRLYWVDAGTDMVESCSLRGTNLHCLSVHNASTWTSGAHLFGLALYNDKLHMTDWGWMGANTVRSRLISMNTDGTDAWVLGSVSGKMNDVHIYSEETWQRGPNGCTGNNMCSHICLPSPGNNYTCFCPDGQVLSGDQRTCVVGTTMDPSVSTTVAPLSACGGNFTAASGTLVSPGFPGRYPNNLDCVYVIRRPEGQRITLSFDFFGLETGRDNCEYDNVTIREGDSVKAPRMNVFCGSKLPRDRRSFGNTMFIRFRSDDSVGLSGFRARYSSAVHKDLFYLITDSHQRIVYRVDHETFSNIPIPLSHYPFAVDFDPVERRVYWTDLMTRDIRTADLDGSNQKRFWISLHGDTSFKGLAVDPLSRLVFYVDTGRRRIGVVTISGQHHASIITDGLHTPRCITLDTTRGIMFWADAGLFLERGSISRANYDGTDRRPLVSVGLQIPNGLALDVARERLYWVDAGTDMLESCDLDGKDQLVVHNARLTSHYFGLALYNNKLYVTDWGEDQASATASELIEMNTDGTEAYIIGTAKGKMNDIHIYSEETWHQEPNGCGENGNACSHICIPSPDLAYRCLCPDGMRMSADSQTTCVIGDAEETVPLSAPRPFFTDPAGNRTMKLTCDPGGTRAVEEVMWSVPCELKTGRSCTWSPRPPEDDGAVVRCFIRYVSGPSASGNFTVLLYYPPLSAPRISGYDGRALAAGSTLAMTCEVNGGNPPVTSVTLTCSGGGRMTSTSPGQRASLRLPSLRTADSGTKCTCTARWSRYPQWYSQSDVVTLSVTDTESAASTFPAAAVGGGVSVAVVVIIVLIVIIIFLLIRRKKARPTVDNPRQPIVWQSDLSPDPQLSYLYNSASPSNMVEPPPAYTSGEYDTLANMTGAEGGDYETPVNKTGVPPDMAQSPQYSGLSELPPKPGMN